MEKNKTGKYFKYAIGEIILVVIGILIALQINNWNEERKRESLKDIYIESLISELKTNIEFLTIGIKSAENDLKESKSFSSRLSSPKATLDTLIKIARYEFNPITGDLNDLNRNTYDALVSTGNIDLLNSELTKKLQKYYAEQSNLLYFIESNLQSYVDNINRYLISYPTKMKHNAINGLLMDTFWENVNHNDLKAKFNGVLTGRNFIHNNAKIMRVKLLRHTQELIKQLESIDKSE